MEVKQLMTTELRYLSLTFQQMKVNLGESLVSANKGKNTTHKWLGSKTAKNYLKQPYKCLTISPQIHSSSLSHINSLKSLTRHTELSLHT